jgi:phosphoglycerate dehydrogenase-like enzyme
MIAPLPTATSSSVGLRREERVLLVVKSHELLMFLPDLSTDRKNFASHEFFHQDPETLGTGWNALLREFRPTVLISCWNTPALPRDWLVESDCSLRYVCHLAGSVRHLVPRVFLERGGLVTNWGAMAGETVAEHALLLALSALRRQPDWQSVISGPVPQPYLSPMLRLRTRTLRRRRVGVHGFGNVARSLIDLLKPFQVEVSVFSEGVPTALIRNSGATPCDSLRELAQHSEVFFECEALTPLSKGSVNAAVLDALPDAAVFINVARGALVDETALHAAASDGRISIALDVLKEDPINPNSPFLALPGAVISPHIAGPTLDLLPECGRKALENLSSYLAGGTPEALVNLDTYDRST